MKLLRLGFTAFGVILAALVCWFLLVHSVSIAAFFGDLLQILMPFLYGAVIAYILSPLCGKFEKVLKKAMPRKDGLCRGLSIALSLLSALLVIVLLILLVIPGVARSIIYIISVLPGQIDSAVQQLHDLLATYPQLQESWDALSEKISSDVSTWLKTDLLSAAQNMIGSVSVQVIGIVTVFKNLFLGILVSVYLLGCRRKFAVQARMILHALFPKKWADAIEEEVHYADRMFHGFLVGRVIDSAIIALICFAAFSIFRFDSALLVSVIVGVTNIIPVFGPYLGAIPCALILLLENPLHCLIFLIFIVILQMVDGNVIGPRILGQTTGVSSFWVLFSVMLFGGLWGLVGMIVGVPVFAVIYDIIRKLTYYGLHRRKRYDLLPQGKADEKTAEDDERSDDMDIAKKA